MTSTIQPWRKFKPEADGTPHGWIQWKGTDVCMDFHCKCGELGHLDGDFVYYVKCGACGQVYELSGHVEAHPIDGVPDDSHEPVVAEVRG
jgi:hypothetical protein